MKPHTLVRDHQNASLQSFGFLSCASWYSQLLMASRQSSSNTLVEGMNQVESKVGCTDPSRKRELQEKILATRCFFKQHEKMWDQI